MNLGLACGNDAARDNQGIVGEHLTDELQVLLVVGRAEVLNIVEYLHALLQLRHFVAAVLQHVAYLLAVDVGIGGIVETGNGFTALLRQRTIFSAPRSRSASSSTSEAASRVPRHQARATAQQPPDVLRPDRAGKEDVISALKYIIRCKAESKCCLIIIRRLPNLDGGLGNLLS